jgi:hypothetical protein
VRRWSRVGAARPNAQEKDMPTDQQQQPRMVRVKNYAENPFDFPQGSDSTKRITFPRGMTPMGDDAKGGFRPGEVIVSESVIKAMKEHRVARAWFDNRSGLVVEQIEEK